MISPKKRSGGFALVITLSLMILLTILAVGLLTLSSVSLRAASQSTDIASARANARLALMLAMGELQKNAGLDTRVTARADLVNASNPPLLGVWKSWEGSDHAASGQPVAPDYSSHKKSRFLAWLVSAPVVNDMDSPPNTVAATGKAILLGAKSVGTQNPNQSQIQLAPTAIHLTSTRGSYAWWVSGENQKARLPRPYAPTTETAATWSVLAKTHATADPAQFGLNSLLADPSLSNPALASPASKAISIHQGDLLGSTNTIPLSQDNFHDLSMTSVGLLTNTATGGWRKDLSLVTENYDTSAFPSSNLPFFRVSPTQDLLFTQATSANGTVAKSLLYPWSDYRRAAVTGNEPIYRFPPISSWMNLARYATLYKTINPTSATSTMSKTAVAYPINGTGTQVGDFIHNVRILPLIARVQWLYYHHVVPVTPATSPVTYKVNLVTQPIITLWNPYNVTLSAPGSISFHLMGSLPPVIKYTICGAAQPKSITLQDSNMSAAQALTTKGAFGGSLTYTINSVQPFTPGQTRVFSPQTSATALEAGYTALKNDESNGVSSTIATVAAGGDNLITTQVSFDSEFLDGNNGVGLYLDMATTAGQVLAYRMLYDKSAAAGFYPPFMADKFIKPSLSEAAAPAPFLSVTFGARMASNTFLPSKGFVQSSPFVNYTAMGTKGTYEDTIKYLYPGVLHNVNSPFEFSFQPLKAAGDYMPDVDGQNRGFIVTGYKISNGLSRCVIDELPGRPLGSLAELQNWDARFENPVPPYAFNLVGNSDASPLLPSNAVVNATEASVKGAENLQNDDSYCLNHVLFDDWFFSTIAPIPVNFGNNGAGSTTKTTYRDFVHDPALPLANRAYKALPEDVAAASTTTEATTLANTNVGVVATSYKTIASRLEVEGMFNVNSTSLKAWRALLGHARNQKIPYFGATGNPLLSSPSDYAVSRFTVAGDVEASQSGNSGTFVGNAQYAGYRMFTATQLDFLAQEIVNQVRLRGPFLSLSEFVNRQLSSGDLAIAGAIQTALNKLASSPQNPYTVLETDTTAPAAGGIAGSNYASANPPPAGSNSGYKFAAAAVGYNIYGLPGWTRQADILRPLAPILSARDDTFTIRAYGDARDSTGTVVRARAVCEATVRRTRQYVDSTDDAATIDISNSAGALPAKKPVNATFGRHFVVVSFRWLTQDEI